LDNTIAHILDVVTNGKRTIITYESEGIIKRKIICDLDSIPIRKETKKKNYSQITNL
jgi:hypothetical protein